jgi:hypothetical protein
MAHAGRLGLVRVLSRGHGVEGVAGHPRIRILV